eukprot:6471340-Prymnesium_polylepis.1
MRLSPATISPGIGRGWGAARGEDWGMRTGAAQRLQAHKAALSSENVPSARTSGEVASSQSHVRTGSAPDPLEHRGGSSKKTRGGSRNKGSVANPDRINSGLAGLALD